MWKRIVGFATLAVVVWAGAGYFSALSACAHDPRFACSPRSQDHPVTIPDAGKSRAYYGSLAASGSDRYRFDLAAPLSVPVNLLVDDRDVKNASRPVFKLERDGTTVSRIDFVHWEKFYEPFSREGYVETPERQLLLPAGHYVATVTMEGGVAPQRYTLAIGNAERFSVFEVPYVLGAIHRIRALQY